MRIKPTDAKVTVFLVGNFNPRIFLPSWFSKNGVMGEEEGEKADIGIIHPDVVKFRTTWLSLLVEKQRFIAEVEQPPNIRLYDFVLKTFREFLIHTPIWAMGINRRVVFNTGSIDKRDQIGIALAPPDAWGEWAEHIKKKEDAIRGGMISLSMRQSIVDDRVEGFIQTQVGPSLTNSSEVFVEVNDHYSNPEKDKVEGCQEIMAILTDNFEKSLDRSEWIIDQVMSIVK